MIEVAERYITKPGMMDPQFFTKDDGIGCCTETRYYIHDTIIDLSAVPLEEQDEAVSLTYGAYGLVERCIIRGAGKLILCGSGDAQAAELERHKMVMFRDCFFEDFGRRGPEVQSSMMVRMERCLVHSWAAPDRFTVRSFAAWAHDGGVITAEECVFVPLSAQDIPFGQKVKDCANWIGQMVNDAGPLALLMPKTYLPGRRRALVATGKGAVQAKRCTFIDDAYTDDPCMQAPDMVTYFSELRERICKAVGVDV